MRHEIAQILKEKNAMADPKDTGISQSALELILQRQHESMIDVVKELRKPTEAEQAKLDSDKAKVVAKAEGRRQAAKADMESKEMRRKGCSHSDPHGQHGWVAQVNADGFYRPLCLQCNTVLPAIKATPQQVQQGIGLNLYKRDGQVMLKHFEEQHKQTVPDCKDPMCYLHRIAVQAPVQQVQATA